MVSPGQTGEEAGAASAAATVVKQAGGSVDQMVCSAIVSAESSGAGAPLKQAVTAGNAAAANMSDGMSLDEALAKAKSALPMIPGWNLASWLQGMNFTQIVSDSLLKRVRERMPPGISTQAYEQAFLVKLGEKASVDTIVAMLKETPVLFHIAETICNESTALRQELEQAEEEARRAEEEKSDPSLAAKRRWQDLRAKRRDLMVAGNNVDLADATMAAKNDAERRNEEAKRSGAFTLSYSTEPALYWKGLTTLTGEPTPQIERSLFDSMTHEHINMDDSTEYFEVGNYGTVTQTRIEWLFVTNPANGLEVLGMEEWPGTESERDLVRQALPFSHFQSKFDGICSRLRAVGEQPLSKEEFYALRCYTGPLFVKYNTILRAGSGVEFFKSKVASLCMGNYYPTTLSLLYAAIIKMGKVTPAGMVYRAPGGALPNSFWHRQPDGMHGGLEVRR